MVLLSKEELTHENNEKRKHERQLEYLIGFIVSHSKSENLKFNNNPKDINKILKVIDDYFIAISRCNIFKKTHPDEADSTNKNLILEKARLSSFWIRNDAFPFQLIKYAKEYYSSFDHWFSINLGFTIEDAIIFYNTIKVLYEKKLKKYHSNAVKNTKKWLKDNLKHNYKDKSDKYEQLETNVFTDFIMSEACNILLFNEDDICKNSSLSLEICRNLLNRFSQSFGYFNSKFPNTFQDPLNSPWDYNTLFEKPILKFSRGYLVPLMFLFPTVLFDSFQFDIFKDEKYKIKYDAIRYKWLEKKTSALLCRVFPKSNVFLNPKYPNGEEICDVLVLFDRNILIFQCKSKKLTLQARTGKSFKKIKEDLEKSIKDSFEQGVRAKNYFNSTNLPKIVLEDREITIDMKQVDSRNIFLISVTLGQFANITTRFMNLEPNLKLFSSNEFPWAVCIFDLEIITEILDKPYYFIHYLLKRLAIEKTDFELTADEIDLLNYYIDKRLDFDYEAFKKKDKKLPYLVSLSNYSKEVDEYLIRKYQLLEKPKKPRVNIPVKIEELISEIDQLDISYKTKIVFNILNLKFEEQEYLLENIDKIIEKARKDKKNKVFSITIKRLNLNILFMVMEAQKDLNRLFNQVEYYSLLAKYNAKTDEVIGMGIDLSTEKIIDTSFYYYREWFQDSIQEKLCRQYLKNFRFI
jgi:hypothetical protein